MYLSYPFRHITFQKIGYWGQHNIKICRGTIPVSITITQFIEHMHDDLSPTGGGNGQIQVTAASQPVSWLFHWSSDGLL